MGLTVFGDPSTFDIHAQNQTIPYSDPALPKGCTTHDAAVAELTKEYPLVEIGALQIHGSATYRFNGKKWVLLP
jgi:hypothetical protein